MSRLFYAVIFCLCAAAPAPAQTLSDVFDMIDEGQISKARETAAPMGDVSRDLAEWAILRQGDGDLADYARFLARRPDWPDTRRLWREAEANMQDAPDDQVAQFFADHVPQTGAGALALAKADPNRAAQVITNAWLSLRLSEDEQAEILEKYAQIVTPLHDLRVDALLWQGRAKDAERMLPLLTGKSHDMAAARLAYLTNAANAGEEPSHLRQDAGVAYARFAWLARRGENTSAAELLRERSASAADLGQPFRWSGWRRSLARWAMRDGQARLAYDLASRSHTTPDDGYNHADLEWLSGYIALTYLDQPFVALEHFKYFRDQVSTPVSLGRAWYWIARAEDASGTDAQASWAEAAKHPSFYGLLAAERLAGAVTMTAPLPVRPLPDQDMIRAVRQLLEANEPGMAYLFVTDLAQTADTGTLEALTGALLARDEYFLTLRVGKGAAARGILIPAAYFPLHPLADQAMDIDPALALAIARQESEFRTNAGSPVGALGLMQLMPGTAKEVAGDLSLPYSRARLTADWQYNVQLGTAYLAGLRESFGNSPVLMAAGYNAGPGRARDWINQRGDPRNPKEQVDPVDWIEHIPFRETRNYVMAVVGAIPLYQARLGQAQTPMRELLMGRFPRPKSRPDTFDR